MSPPLVSVENFLAGFGNVKAERGRLPFSFSESSLLICALEILDEDRFELPSRIVCIQCAHLKMHMYNIYLIR